MQILESHTIILLIIVKILVHCTYLHKQKNASLVIFSQSLSLNEIQILASFFGEYVGIRGRSKKTLRLRGYLASNVIGLEK